MKRLLLLALTLLTTSLQSAIYDCFTFFNETEVLRIRLEELYDVVDHFVLVEGTKTYTGKDKPLYYAENRELFKKYEDKIIHIVVDDFAAPTQDEHQDHWDREAHSRNKVMEGLQHANPEDIIFLSDLDEIPSKSAVQRIQEYFNQISNRKNLPIEKLVCSLDMRLFMFKLNRESPVGWNGGSKAAPFRIFLKYLPWDFKILHHKHPNLHTIKNAGWHFNTIGDNKFCLTKWLATGPLYDLEPFLLSLWENEELLDQTYQYHIEISQTSPIPFDNTFPQYILENLEYYRSIGFVEGGY